MKRLIIGIAVLVSVALSYSYNVKHFKADGTVKSASYSTADTSYSQVFNLDEDEVVNLSTNLTGTANAGNYIMNDIQGFINGSWITIVTDSAGVGYSNYTLRSSSTINVPVNSIRLQTRRFVASGTLTSNQQLNGY